MYLFECTFTKRVLTVQFCAFFSSLAVIRSLRTFWNKIVTESSTGDYEGNLIATQQTGGFRWHRICDNSVEGKIQLVFGNIYHNLTYYTIRWHSSNLNIY